MSADKSGQKSAADGIPDLLALTPALAERAWQKWLADRDPFEGELEKLAHCVLLSIRQWGLNRRDPAAEEIARKYLVESLAAFWAAYKLAAE